MECEFCLNLGWYYVATEARKITRNSRGHPVVKYVRENIRTPCICPKGVEWVKAKQLGFMEIKDMKDD